MIKKHIIIIIIVIVFFLIALGFAHLQDIGQKIDFDGGRITTIPQSPEPSQSQPHVSPSKSPPQSQLHGGEISYEPEDSDDPDVLAKQARIRELIHEVYSLKNYYVSKINSMEATAKSEYLALPDEEHTQDNKESIASRYINSAYSLEAECDSKIDSICSELGVLLLETNGDFSLINKVRYTYASEKATMKDEIKQTYSEFFS